MDGIREDRILTNGFYNHFAALISLIILLILLFAMLVWFRFDEGLVTIFTIGFIIDAIPTLYLHLEYWLKNRGEKYEVHFDELIREKGGERKVYKTSEIERIKVYMSPALYKGSNFHILGIEAYHYARIYLISGEKLVITCLLTPKVEQALRGLRGVKIERKKRLFCTIDEG